MSCELAHTAVHGYFDGELDAVRAAEFERHLQDCAECSDSLSNLQSLRSRLQQAELYEGASPRFENQLRNALAKQKGWAESPSPSSTWRRWFLVPAFAIFCVAAALTTLLLLQSRQQQDRVVAELIDAHIRSLQPGHLTDVVSSDQHTVKPWFDGKLDFIPSVHDYADQGFPLLGGRLDALDGRSVAAIVYGRRKHLINLFVWPDRDTKPFAGSGSSNGYNWLIWRSGDMDLCLVSDVAPPDLGTLKELLSK